MPDVEIHPLTTERWEDLERLFGPNGAAAGCWCMWWRRTDYSESRLPYSEENRRSLRAIVESGPPPGLLAYLDGEPAGWISLGPREDFPRLNRSRHLKPLDDQPVWAVVCFFVGRKARGHGLSARLLDAARDYARQQGATLLEGYPVSPREGRVPAGQAYTGLLPVFERAGFAEVAHRGGRRHIVRLELG